MAKPRIFISSTYYDQKHVRADLEKFLVGLGYEAIRFERGHVTYGKEESPEHYAYKEVEQSDLIVSIVGGRYGTEAKQLDGHSISSLELQHALEAGIQVFIFVQRDVLAEYGTYQLNKDNSDVKYKHVEDHRVFEFIESLYGLQKNNPIATFDSAEDIIQYLRLQFAGLFKRFLNDQKRLAEVNVLQEMRSIADTLKELVDFLSTQNSNNEGAIRNILLPNHPAFRRFCKLTDTNYRIFFTNKGELNTWLRSIDWKPVPKNEMDSDSVSEWNHPAKEGYLKLIEDIFDEKGKLKVYTEHDWKDSWIERVIAFEPDDDLPF